MSRYNRCKECYNMKCVFVTGEREDFDTSECPDFRPLTNADLIRQMSDEELADFIGTHDCLDCPLNNEDDWCAGTAGSCRGNVLEWLKSQVEVGE